MTAQTVLKPDLYFSADISQVDPLDDGTCVVYGIPVMPGVLDNDKQMVDPAWLKTALAKWYATGPNVREMHQPIAAGTGTGLDWKGDIPYLTAHVVDEAAAKKVRAKVLRAFSMGVKNPVTRRDSRAPNGLIVGGDIIEMTLCDRPCIPGSDILDFKADMFKMAGFVAEDEIVDYQRGFSWKCAPIDLNLTQNAEALKAAGVHNKEMKVADTDTTKTADELGDKTVDAATDKAADLEESAAADETKSETEAKTVEAASEKASTILAEMAEKAAKSVYCSGCEKSMEIQDGKEQTVKGNRMLVGQCEKGHKLTKFVPDEKAADADTAKTTDSDEAKAAESDAAKADDADKSVEAEKAPEADTVKADSEKDDMEMSSGAAKTVEKAAVTDDAVMGALKTLLKSAGIDLEKISAQVQKTRAEQLSEKLAEFQQLTDGIAKSAESGGTSSVTGLDPSTLNQMRSVLDEINQLADQMAPGNGLVKPGNEHVKGTVDMGGSHVATPTDRIDLQSKAIEPDLAKVVTTIGTVEHLDAAELAKSLAAEFTKGIEPLVKRLEEVEYSVKPASPPILIAAERGNAFVGKQAVNDAQEKLAALSDDDRAKLAAAVLADQRGWTTPA